MEPRAQNWGAVGPVGVWPAKARWEPRALKQNWVLKGDAPPFARGLAPPTPTPRSMWRGPLP